MIEGIDAARAAGIAVKINVVALRDSTEMEVDHLLRFAHDRDMTLTFIETMPLGDIGVDRIDSIFHSINCASLSKAAGR